MHPSRASGTVVAHSSTCDIASTYWTGVLCSSAWVRMYIARHLWELWVGLVRLLPLRLCNHITDQFSCFELTRGRNPSSSSCHQTFRFHCSVHLYPISLNLRRSSNVHGCVKREHCNICAVFSSSSPHAHVVSPLQ